MHVLFFAEAVTLAHVARPLQLARSAVAAGCKVSIACDERYRHFVVGPDWEWLPLTSIPSTRFAQALARGSPVFDLPTLRAYSEQDRVLIRACRPDLIVGDFRLSLSVSARLAEVPYAALSNAYWSPFVVDRRFPLPALPMTKVAPIAVAQRLFDALAPLAMKMHCRPLNLLRREHGLSDLGSDLRRVYTDADYTLYADAPEMFDLKELPRTHRFLGPVLWSPPGATPPWWDRLPGERPLVYVTLGSSGNSALLSDILGALSDLPITLIVSSAGAHVAIDQRVRNAYVADYLPGTQAAAKSRLVICNGGSPTSQQALSAGVPVLGIASNMDQFLNMRSVAGQGAGRVLRADRLRAPHLRDTVKDMLEDGGELKAARALKELLARHDSATHFRRLLKDVDGATSASPLAAEPAIRALRRQP